ncbi:MAG: demethoxyubiquinone hydroxylase family protein [Pseudomonadota bacterium]
MPAQTRTATDEPPAEPAPFSAYALTGEQLAALRSDHAGEFGAVMIYRGILAVSRDATVLDFARHHLETEARHLAFFDNWLPPEHRSALLPIWRVAGWITGALPALFGPRWVYATIEAVETFVVEHYEAQLAMNLPKALEQTIASFMADEDDHRQEAAGHRRGRLLRVWRATVGKGSALAVKAAMRL